MADRKRGARLKISRTPRDRQRSRVDAVLEREDIPHLSLNDWRLPAPPGWTGREVKVDELPEDIPPEVTA